MNWEFLLRLFVAAMLSTVIGLEREYRAKEAGYRTHFLVGMGSALFMLVSQYGFETILRTYPNVSLDPSRIASQVVTGIGFIGAGTIIFQRHIIRGLTTAAGLWVTSAIGLVVGAGMYELGVAATVLTLLCLEAMNLIFKKIGLRSIVLVLSIEQKQAIKAVYRELEACECIVVSFKMEQQRTAEGYLVTMVVKAKRSNSEASILTSLQEVEGVTVETLE